MSLRSHPKRRGPPHSKRTRSGADERMGTTGGTAIAMDDHISSSGSSGGRIPSRPTTQKSVKPRATSNTAMSAPLTRFSVPTNTATAATSEMIVQVKTTNERASMGPSYDRGGFEVDREARPRWQLRPIDRLSRVFVELIAARLAMCGEGRLLVHVCLLTSDTVYS